MYVNKLDLISSTSEHQNMFFDNMKINKTNSRKKGWSTCSVCVCVCVYVDGNFVYMYEKYKNKWWSNGNKEKKKKVD